MINFEDCGAVCSDHPARADFPNKKPNELLIHKSAPLTLGFLDPTEMLRHARHELGHTMGLRHEHIRYGQSGDGCEENALWRAVTDPDADSIMGYGACAGTSPNTLSVDNISPRDRLSLSYLYNLPRNEVPSYTSEDLDDLLWFTPSTGKYVLWRATPHPKDTILFAPEDMSEFCAFQTDDGCLGAEDNALMRGRPIPAVLAGDPATDRLTDIVTYGPGTKTDSLLFHAPSGPLEEAPAAINASPFDLATVGLFKGSDAKEEIWWIRPGTRTDPRGELTAAGYSVNPNEDFGSGAGKDLHLRPLVGLWADQGSTLPNSQIIWYAEGATGARLSFQSANFQTMEEVSVSPACLLDTLVNSIPLRGDFERDDPEGKFHMEVFWASPESGNHVFWRDTASMWNLDNNANVCGDPQVVQTMHTPAGLASAKPFVGDFDGDGIDDIFWYTPNSTPDVIWLRVGDSDGPEVTSPFVNGTSNPFIDEFDFTPVVGDFNGDLCDDILWFAPHRDYAENTDLPTGGMDVFEPHPGASPLWRSNCDDGSFTGFTSEIDITTPPGAYPVGYDPRLATRRADLQFSTP